MNSLKIIINTLILLLCVGVGAPAESDFLELTTQKVITFKNGYSLVIKSGSAITSKNCEIYTDQVPDAAVLGSFWATASEGHLKSMYVGWSKTPETVTKRVKCSNKMEILQVNQGKQATVTLQCKTILRGKIFVLEGPHFVLETQEGCVLLDVSQVALITIDKMQIDIDKTTTKERSKILTFQFERPGEKRKITLMYFRPGIRWIPTYRIQLQNAKTKTATITLQAEIINEAEDFIDVPFDIVVGVPNFRFQQTVSPLILESTLRNAIQQASPQLAQQMGQNLSNALFTQRTSEFRRHINQQPSSESSNLQVPEELAAAGTQDLFVYNLPKLKIAKSGRAAVHIFTAQVPYHDIYTWDLYIQRKDIAMAPSGKGIQSPLVLSQNKIWHQIELTNTTIFPWTTGAALIMQNNQPLAQELLTYTPVKNVVRVPVTVSVDTRGGFVETETKRTLKALYWDNYYYAEIHNQIKLDLLNNKNLPIDIEITLHFGGKADKASLEGDIGLQAYSAADWEYYRGSTAVNNSSTVHWKTSIQPGETFQPTVWYHYYTRH